MKFVPVIPSEQPTDDDDVTGCGGRQALTLQVKIEVLEGFARSTAYAGSVHKLEHGPSYCERLTLADRTNPTPPGFRLVAWARGDPDWRCPSITQVGRIKRLK